ncbi:ACT domain-containing protein [Desulfatitalea alkaliphila]|uniref:Amino acid-binding protein n=1 Tax=Desulfatitalea alkaliphila TaxID=2929485 RepID=A0AA41R0U7_9BACT|nr:ACT domain-containing protein [Desulfatitalea alkaliphila]MCJ8499135.1 amino acid-binding protein [Desulfatitalea alkaliphila]
MVRTEISLFMQNAPGELGKLTALFGQAGINIDAITIQDASSYVRELFKARGKSLKRIASAASYNSMSKDSADFALVRLLPSDGMTDKTMDLLSEHDYLYDIQPVIAVKIGNRPGELAKMATRLGNEGININYVYGSVAGPDEECLFVFCPEDLERAAKVFKEEGP